MAKQYPDKKFEMGEWCELPMQRDPYSNESAMYMANIIMQDLSWMNAVSWQSWTAVNADGMLELKDGGITEYNRYYAYKQFSAFIKPGMTRVKVKDSFGDKSQLSTVGFMNDEQTVIVIINNGPETQKTAFYGDYESMKVYRTYAHENCYEIYSGDPIEHLYLVPASITTVVFDN